MLKMAQVGPFMTAALLFIATDSGAQVLHDYRCVIQRMESGNLQGKAREYWQRHYVGKEFTVERRTGMMAGILKNAYVTKPDVIDPGSTVNSFKAVTTMKREQGVGFGSNVYALVVNEFEDSPQKSFVFLENRTVFFGTCVHF